jgi:uncharacterized membrane protein
MSDTSTASNGFIISNTIKKSWSIFKKEWIMIYALTLLPMILGFVYSFVTGMTKDPESYNIVMHLIYMLLQFIISMGVIKGFLQVIRGKEVNMETFTSMFPLIIKYLVAQIILSVIIFVGLIFFIVPGIYFAIKYMFAPYLVIDKEMGPIEAMKASAKLTKGIKWDIIGFIAAIVILMYSGIIALLVGLIITVPLATLAYVNFYNVVSKRLK